MQSDLKLYELQAGRSLTRPSWCPYTTKQGLQAAIAGARWGRERRERGEAGEGAPIGGGSPAPQSAGESEYKQFHFNDHRRRCDLLQREGADW